MEELIKSIQEIGQRDIIDIIAIFSPILLSMVAIGISIYTVHKQNKISLFEKRYYVLTEIITLLEFERDVDKCDNMDVIWSFFDSCFKTNVKELNSLERLIQTKIRINSFKNDIFKIDFLFNHRCTTNLSEIYSCFDRYILSVLNGEPNVTEKEELHMLCEAFRKADLNILTNELKF